MYIHSWRIPLSHSGAKEECASTWRQNCSSSPISSFPLKETNHINYTYKSYIYTYIYIYIYLYLYLYLHMYLYLYLYLYLYKIKLLLPGPGHGRALGLAEVDEDLLDVVAEGAPKHIYICMCVYI